ncbi:MAG: hypothetical protein BWY13_00948 [Euryarchaeota archaeon ADurb.Bin190]|nr:MAG: hypothetical protein BWY13_00948 [Euryarchaeota archaeon ADurb.Bin190]
MDPSSRKGRTATVITAISLYCLFSSLMSRGEKEEPVPPDVDVITKAMSKSPRFSISPMIISRFSIKACFPTFLLAPTPCRLGT